MKRLLLVVLISGLAILLATLGPEAMGMSLTRFAVVVLFLGALAALLVAK